jgi:NAD(P)-dependent dehydrogenase (short-subunit alcohol dehydrogenase family)
VTGAARGIGRAVAERFSADGASVALWDINGAAADAVRRGLKGSPSTHVAIEVDVGDSQSVEAAARLTHSQLGVVRVLVNNARVAHQGSPLAQIGDDEWQATLNVNLTGYFRCMRSLAPNMIAAREGSIVNIAAMSAFTAFKGTSAAYAASKGAIISLTYSAALEFAEYGIRVNAVCPGITRPRDAADPDPRLPQLMSSIQLRPSGGEARTGYPEEIAEAVWFLASPRSSWVTGASLVVSGGQLFR